MDRAAKKAFPGLRLVQAAFHNRSLILYTKLGFDTREPLSVMQGPALRRKPDGFDVRPARPGDLDACNHVCQRIRGHDSKEENHFMDRTERIQALYSELSEVQAAMKPFVTPRSADNPKPWTQEDLERYFRFHNRLNEIIVELSKLEGGLP
jgi:hypothetical protein